MTTVREMYNNTLLCVGPYIWGISRALHNNSWFLSNACDTICKNYPHLRGYVYGEMAAQVGK